MQLPETQEVGIYAGGARTRTEMLSNGLSAAWTAGDELALWARTSSGSYALSNQVFKTLVARGERTGINVFCIPVCCELDLKKAAKVAGDKNMEMVAVKELLGLTGYIRGGCSPVGMKKKFPTYLDETGILWEEIAVSAGARGHQMILPPEALAQLVGAKFVDLIL